MPYCQKCNIFFKPKPRNHGFNRSFGCRVLVQIYFLELLPEKGRYPKNKYAVKKVVVVRWFLWIFKQIPTLFFAILPKMLYFLNRSQEIMVTNKISVTHEFLFIIIFIFPADDQINFALHPFHSLIGIQLVDKFYI